MRDKKSSEREGVSMRRGDKLEGHCEKEKES
jgi:hypothetical protein